MTAKILWYNDEVAYISMYWPLTIEEVADPQVQYDMCSFEVEECLGAKLV